MRHLRSILYALGLAPAVWILSGVGFTQNLTGRARDNGGVESLSGLLLLVLAGTAYAILVLAPISPAGPTLFGLVFLGIAGWALVSPSSYAAAWPAAVAKDGFDLSLPGYGLATLLAVPLVCTGLSARRWERYEPPQIPLFGTLVRPRGAAAVAGTPIAGVTTEIVDLGTADRSAERTQVIELPATQVSETPPGERVTEAVATQVIGISGADEPTKDVAASSSDVPAVPAGAEPSEESMPAVDQSEAATADVQAVGEQPDESTVAIQPVGERTEQTTVAIQLVGERTEETTVAVQPIGEQTQETTVAVQPVGEQTRETTVVVEQPAEPTVDVEPVDGQLEPLEAGSGTPAETGAAPDEDEKTQVIRPSAGDRTTRNLETGVGEASTHNLDDGGKTQVIGPGERTQVIQHEHGAETQVISRSQPRTEPIDGEKTQVIQAGTGTVEPPGDRTQVLTFHAENTPGERSTVRKEAVKKILREEPERLASIVGEERPNPGQDPTTRIVPPDRPAREPGEETTVDVGNGKRVLTVIDLERPADEAADDTTRLAVPPAPTQRRPAEQ